MTKRFYTRGQTPLTDPKRLAIHVRSELEKIERGFNGVATQGGNVTEANLTLSDVTTDDVSTAHHGFVPKLPNDAKKYLDGTGAWSTPAGGGGSGAPALGAFPNIAGLAVRLSAELSAITLATGNTVQQINDLSGNGRHFAAPAAGNRPGYHKTRFNLMRPALTFDGKTSYLQSMAALGIPQPFTVVCVEEGWQLGAQNAKLWSDTNGNPEAYMDGSQTGWYFYAGTVLSNNGLQSQAQQGAPIGLGTKPAIQIAVFNGANSVVSNNGVEIAGNVGANGLTNKLNLGGTGGADWAKVHIYELLVYNRALTAAERTSLNQYYAAALAIQL